MARVEKITNKIDLLAFVYDPATLPTAIIEAGTAKMSVHGLREGEEGVLEKCLKEGGVEIDKEGKFSVEAKAYRFHEDLGYGRTCYATHFSARQEALQCGNIEEWAVKTFDMCA